MREQNKDVWDKLQVVAVLIASVLLPVALAFVGNEYSKSAKDAENRIKYVELAVSILRAEPKAENASLRSWAVDLLQHHAIVPLSKDAQAQLKAQRLSAYPGGWDTSSGGNWSTTYPCYKKAGTDLVETICPKESVSMHPRN